MPTPRHARRDPSRSAGRRPAASLLVALASLLAVVLGACGTDDSGSPVPTSVDDNPGDTATFQPVAPGVLTVVTSLPGPGFFEGSDDDPAKLTGGYEYDLAKLLQQKLGLERLLIRDEPFDDIVAGKISGYDLALSQISITAERRQAVDFTKPYFQSQQGVLMKTGSPPIDTLDKARSAEWGVQTASTALTLLNQRLQPTRPPEIFPELVDAYLAVDAGTVDAVLVDMAINLGEAARSNGRFVVVAQFEQADGPDEYGGVVPKGSPNLPIFDALITDLGKTGELKRLAGENLTKDPEDIPVIKL